MRTLRGYYLPERDIPWRLEETVTGGDGVEGVKTTCRPGI